MLKRHLEDIIYNSITESLDLKNIGTYNYVFNGEKEDQKIELKYIGYSFFVKEIDENVDVNFYVLDRPFSDIILPPALLNGTKQLDKMQVLTIDYYIDRIDTQFTKSNLSILLKILKTVMEITKEVKDKYDVRLFALGATEKDADSKTKITIYKTLANNKPDGWMDIEREINNQNIIVLYDGKTFS